MSNAIRGVAAEFGLAAAKGPKHLGRLLDRLEADEDLPPLARELFAAQAVEFALLQAKIAEVDARLTVWRKAEPRCQRLIKIYGIAFAPWVEQLLKRNAPKLVAVALANKMARIAWKLMATGESSLGRSSSVVVAEAA